MIVWQSTHDALRFKYVEMEMKLTLTMLQLKNLQREHAKVVLENASLRRQLHSEGQRFNSLARSQSSAFSDADLKQLIALCHPDKHGGSKIANEITAKLIQMRKK